MLARVVAIATPVITLLLLTAVGLDLRLADFHAIRERTRLVVAGVLLPVILLPLLAWALAYVLASPPPVSGGLLLLAISPMGGLATTYSLVGRANAALSVTLVASACAAALMTIPLASAGLDLLEGGDGHRVTAPVATLARQIFLVLVPPVAIGMAVRARWPAEAMRALPRVQRTAFLLLVGLILLVLADTVGRPSVPWAAAFAVMAMFTAAAFVAGSAVGRCLAAPAEDRFVLGVAFATRNVAVALAVALSVGRHAEFLWLAAVYLLVQMPVLAVTALVRARLSAT